MAYLLAIAGLATMSPSLAAHAAPDDSFVSHCPRPAYPRQSARLTEEGISLLAFLIRADGSVGNAMVLSSSGTPELDQAGLSAIGQCRFTPVVKDGVPIDVWDNVQYDWTVEGDNRMRAGKRQALLAAADGNPEGLYRLSLIMMRNAATDERQQEALAVLRRAADAGQPNAQFRLGRRYEKGDGVEANLDEAMRWYGKAAARGDVLAVQRLKLGELISH
jgi:TonB family protein